MNEQNIDPKPDDDNKMPKSGNLNPTGLDEWNERLDHNLEPESTGDIRADENAEEYQRKVGHEQRDTDSED